MSLVCARLIWRWTAAAGPPRDIHRADPWGPATTAQAAGWAVSEQSCKDLVHRDPHVDPYHHFAVDHRGVVNEVSRPPAPGA